MPCDDASSAAGCIQPEMVSTIVTVCWVLGHPWHAQLAPRVTLVPRCVPSALATPLPALLLPLLQWLHAQGALCQPLCWTELDTKVSSQAHNRSITYHTCSGACIVHPVVPRSRALRTALGLAPLALVCHSMSVCSAAPTAQQACAALVTRSSLPTIARHWLLSRQQLCTSLLPTPPCLVRTMVTVTLALPFPALPCACPAPPLQG